MKNSNTASALSLAALCVTAGCGTVETPTVHSAPGLDYRLGEITEPRPNRAHILRVDLSQGNHALAVVMGDDPDGSGPAEAALTNPLQMAVDCSARAFVNTAPWDDIPDGNGEKTRAWYEGQEVDIHGLAVSQGKTRSAARPGNANVWVTEQGTVHISDEPPGDDVVEGVGGFGQIIRDGVLLPSPGGAIHPRTALGVDRSGTVVWLVVVDGRQEEFSEGMSVHELGTFMLALNCWNAANLDGGGSSVMGLANERGQLRVVNSPSDRSRDDPHTPKIRPVPVILTIREK